MSRTAFFSRRSYGALMSRLVWPTAALLILTLAFVFTTILWTSESANSTAGKRQRVQLTGAIDQQLEELKSRLADIVGGVALLDTADKAPALSKGELARAAVPGLHEVFVLPRVGSLDLIAGAGMTEVAARDLMRDLIAALASGERADVAGPAAGAPARRDRAVSGLAYDGRGPPPRAALPPRGPNALD